MYFHVAVKHCRPTYQRLTHRHIHGYFPRQLSRHTTNTWLKMCIIRTKEGPTSVIYPTHRVHPETSGVCVHAIRQMIINDLKRILKSLQYNVLYVQINQSSWHCRALLINSNIWFHITENVLMISLCMVRNCFHIRRKDYHYSKHVLNS